jgi:AcrR family transcriptional regulator
MPDFDWRTTQGLPLERRFPDDAIGRREWQRLVEDIAGLGPAAAPERHREMLERFLGRLRGSALVQRLRRPPQCRVFVSHRMVDVAVAEQIAWLAHRQGLGYWLDVHDPQLRQANASPLPSPAQEILIAAIIEMGLLNATHVIAAMTINAAGSKWIPYEYGRAKDATLHSAQAAVWLEAGVRLSDCGEYVRLGAITHTRADITGWLAAHRGCIPPWSPWGGQGPPRMTIP